MGEHSFNALLGMEAYRYEGTYIEAKNGMLNEGFDDWEHAFVGNGKMFIRDRITPVFLQKLNAALMRTTGSVYKMCIRDRPKAILLFRWLAAHPFDGLDLPFSFNLFL